MEGTEVSGAPEGEWTKVSDSSDLPSGGRLHFKIGERFLTVLCLKGELHCMDSICFHAGGPLGIGDIEDVNGRSCIVCPWHFYKIDVVTGEKYYQTVSFVDGKMVPGEWKSNGPRQRMHSVQRRDDGLYVQLNSEGSVSSDGYACDAACGARVVGGVGSLPGGSGGAGGSGKGVAGADGKLPSSLRYPHACGPPAN